MNGASRAATSLLTAAVWLAGLFLGPTGAQAAVTGDNPCPSLSQPAGMGDSIAAAVQFPYVPAPDPMRYYDGAILRPADTVTYPGKRPAVVLQHGWGEDMCSLWWAAQYLAGHGYVVSIHTTPFYGDPDNFFVRISSDLPAIQDTDAAVIDYLKGAGNVFAAQTDPDRIGFVGHGVGSISASLIAGVAPELGIGAVVALNNLHAFLGGDAGGAGVECALEVQGRPLPAVPALGIAMDRPCESNPTDTSPDLKLLGWDLWRSYEKPTMELVMRGYDDSTFVGDNGGITAWMDMGHYMDVWFRRWLDGDPGMDAELLSKSLNGRPTVQALSSSFNSAAYLPPAVDTSDLAGCLSGTSRCDGKKDPIPDPARFSLRIGLPSHRLRQGSTSRLSFTLTNNGGTEAAAKICVRSRLLDVLGIHCHKMGRIEPGGSSSTDYRIRTRPGVRPGRRVSLSSTVYSAAGEIHRTTKLRIVRSPRHP